MCIGESVQTGYNLTSAREGSAINQLQQKLADVLSLAGYPGKWWGNPPERFHFWRDDAPPLTADVWLEFDDPETLDGVSLRVDAMTETQKRQLADRHAPATLSAIGLTDPETAAELQRQLAAAREAGEPTSDLVRGEDEEGEARWD